MFTYQLIETLTSRDVGRIIHLYTMPCYDIDEEHSVYMDYKNYHKNVLRELRYLFEEDMTFKDKFNLWNLYFDNRIVKK